MDVVELGTIPHDLLVQWCQRVLGSPPVTRFLETGHLSAVIGVELEDGRRTVIKVREPSERVAACAAIQMTLFRQGFPCAELLAGPEPFGDLVATAESYIPRGEQPPSPPPAGPCASLLAALVAMTPPPALYPALAGAPPWVAWDHAGPGLWPPPDDLALDLNERSSPDGLDAYAERIRARLRGVSGRHVIGHIDWEARNLEWHGGEPVAVHDWDSLAIRPEATVAGVAAVVYPSFSEVVAAEIDQTDTFLAAYGERRSLDADELQQAWAAGAWVLVYNAKKESCGGGIGYLEHVEREIDERLRRAGC